MFSNPDFKHVYFLCFDMILSFNDFSLGQVDLFEDSVLKVVETVSFDTGQCLICLKTRCWRLLKQFPLTQVSV